MRTIAFYLPQFHPIPENDHWWGPGFTEWHNVARARPRFRGHRQPQLPERLGFYDLRLAATRKAQAELARRHGIEGFCYYHFWFNGRMLLQQPLNEVLDSGRPDYPFCVCWANENWTRRWDGGDREILLGQDYNTYDPRAHVQWLHRAFSDPRYITVAGRPLFLIYNPSTIPDLSRRVSEWRSAAEELGLPGLHLCATLSVRNTLTATELRDAGFDDVIDFMPRPDVRGRRLAWNRLRYLPARAFNKLLRHFGWDDRLPRLPVLNRFSYSRLARNAARRWADRRDLLPCVVPSWDNSPRKRVDADVYQNDDPAEYGRWLRAALRLVRHRPAQERLVFINAWNEWAEGCHLEPDTDHGLAFLAETRAALDAQTEQPRPVVEPASAPAHARAEAN